MNCNQDLHQGLIQDGEVICPFCCKQLQDPSTVQEHCCDNEDIISDLGYLICLNCGQVHGPDIVPEYIDFYENMHKIRRKSIYQRKYHLENVITNICLKERIEITRCQIQLICRIFDEIGRVLSQVDNSRKRMISCKFILRQVFKMMGIPYQKIQITKSKRTLASYKKYWMSTMDLISDKIEMIIDK